MSKLSSKRGFLVCLRALAKMVQHMSYSDIKVERLKTSQGIFEWFVMCLLNQNVTREQYFRVVNTLRRNGWLNYEKILTIHPTDLRQALSSFRFPNKATKSIFLNVEKIERDYEGNLHNVYLFSEKDTLKVWGCMNEFYWFGVKKSAVFLRPLVSEGLWKLDLKEIPMPPDSRIRRVMFRLGLIKDRRNFKEVQQVARELSKKAKITPLDLDCVLWRIGEICRERKWLCEKCALDCYCQQWIKKP